ncbi:MAG: hypothetical protein EA423_04855 [Phycisphaerales bacterium]|nr:MAG: hypothetical protein EA423_04855 [Phycisphaerales bacterium]
MAMLYCGIDEAGYGPLLGPLSVGVSAFRVGDWNEGDPPPDLWRSLASAVCKDAAGAENRLPIGDSKKLKLSNSLKTRHPLTHLERTVLAVLRRTGADVRNDAQLFETLGARWGPQRWYSGEPVAMPLASAPGSAGIDANLLGAACSKAGVEPVLMGCALIDETDFNRRVREAGTKAAAVGAGVQAHLRRIDALAREQSLPVRVVCDRLGGRTDYRALLEQALGRTVSETDRTPASCRYDCGNGLIVIFTPEADGTHLPTALASMIAKLVRELAMLRFNRHWSGLLPELKPTAGYRQDAKRWLLDASPVLSPQDREAMIRIA